MKLALQLAYRNLIGAGLRTWLTVLVLSFSFIVIIFFNGIMDGWNQQAREDSINWEYGQGQLIHSSYDAFDPFTIQDAHGELPQGLDESGAPILVAQGSIYPGNRMVSVILKGIKSDQNVLKLPTRVLTESDAEIPVLIGKRMASSTKLVVGDKVVMRWRDSNGTFDATEVTVAGIFDCHVAAIDNGQVWMDIKQLQEMTQLQGQATMMVSATDIEDAAIADSQWVFEDKEELLSDLTALVEMKKSSTYFFYILLLGIALLAIFDTQVLSIFRRQKEIGTYVSLGLTRQEVVGLFTAEGSMYSILAAIMAAIYGIPLLGWIAKNGIGIPQSSQEMGITISDRIFPVYGLGLVLSTILIVVIAATIVSYLPSRKIARMNPVEALKGKLL